MKTNQTIQIRKPADWFILKMTNTDKTAIDDKGQTQHINLIPSLENKITGEILKRKKKDMTNDTRYQSKSTRSFLKLVEIPLQLTNPSFFWT